MKAKHTPLRRCIGCLETRPKVQLTRIVRLTKANQIDIDKSGKTDGRGAYICRNQRCIQLAKKTKRLNRSFKCNINNEIYEKLDACEQ